jgi:TRAP-type transport system periplasmic protein
MKHRILSIVGALLVALCLGAPSLAAQKIMLRWNTTNAPLSITVRSMETFKAEIEKSTNGQVQVDIFHSGSLYTDQGEKEALKRGDLEMIWTDPFWLADKMPYLSMFTAGYAFRDYNHMTKTFNGEIGRKIFDDVAKQLGMRPLGALYFGSRQLSFRNIGRVVRTPADMKGLVFRMPNTPSYLFLGEALGAKPTPLALSEVYLALSTGTIDGQDNPLGILKSNKFYEVTKYITLTHHVVAAIWPTISEPFWQKLTPDLQSKILAAVEVARKFCDSSVLGEEDELVGFFKQQGITVVEPDLNAFVTNVQQAYLNNTKLSSTWDMALFEKVKAVK